MEKSDLVCTVSYILKAIKTIIRVDFQNFQLLPYIFSEQTRYTIKDYLRASTINMNK